jgi:hypothetical protein
MRTAFLGVLGARTTGLAGLAALVLVGALFATGCRPNDLGSFCELTRPVCESNGDDPENCVVSLQVYHPADQTKDYIATGVVDCEHFTCVHSAGHEGDAYCTRTCFDDDQCRGGERPDLVCRELVLDDAFIADLCTQLGPERCEEIFGTIQQSKYCALPLEE